MRPCPVHTRKDERRWASRQYHHLYNDRRWRDAREAFLTEHPLCADPYGEHGSRPALATVVDHVVAHKGDVDLFWDQGNWQPLCKRCNDRKAASEGGFGR